MELFSEIYGCYYEVVAEILRHAPVSRRQIEDIVNVHGYGESTLQLIPKLLSQAWPFLEKQEQTFSSRLKHPPRLPVTTLERAWLKSLLEDPRIRLFLTAPQYKHLSEALQDVQPLYRQDDFYYFDRYSDGDPYTDLGYRERFRILLRAMREQSVLHVVYEPPDGTVRIGDYCPLRLEYSAKDDKFRVYAAKLSHGVLQDCHILNLGRISEAKPSQVSYSGTFDLDAWRRNRYAPEPLRLRVMNERNGIERFLVEFSSYEKQSEYDRDSHTCTVTLWYQKDDEKEVLIRLLGFGPVIQLLGSESFVGLIRERIVQQTTLTTS